MRIVFFVLFPFFALSSALPEKPMCVIIPSYNNIKYYKRNLDSIFMQNYENYRIIYIDDCSTDGTGKAVRQYLQRYDLKQRTQLFLNYERVGAMANIYEAVHSCSDEDIILLVDGDDWLYHKNVFKQLNEIYEGNVWFTHGTLMEYPWGHVSWCEPIPSRILESKLFRECKCPSHLRTFYAWLFKKIRLHDFLYKGEFLKMTWDMAIMFPLAEMAEERHAFISDVNYVYNIANPINDNKVNADLQNNLDRLIRNRPPYQRLENRDNPATYR